MFAKRADAIAFRRMVACGKVMNIILACEMCSLLRNLAADKRVEVEIFGVLNKVLSTTTAPTDSYDLVSLRCNMQGGAIKRRMNAISELCGAQWTIHCRIKQQILAAAFVGDAYVIKVKPQPELRIIAKLRMGIEWEMVGDETDAILNQCA